MIQIHTVTGNCSICGTDFEFCPHCNTAVSPCEKGCIAVGVEVKDEPEKTTKTNGFEAIYPASEENTTEKSQ